MSIISKSPRVLFLAAMLAGSASVSLAAQPEGPPPADLSTSVDAAPASEGAALTAGPVIEGFISARSGDRLQVTSATGATTVVAINDATQIKSSGGFLGLSRSSLAAESLLNGLPVTIKTLQRAMPCWPARSISRPATSGPRP